MTTQAPLYWVKQIQDALIEAKAFPLFGFAPAFPWDALSEKIGMLLDAPELKISARQTRLLPAQSLDSGMGNHPIVLALELTPLSGQVFWIMAKEDVAKFTALVLATAQGKGFTTPQFQEGFYYFLATQVVAVFSELQALDDLSPKIGKFSSLPQEPALCIDVDIQHPKTHLWGRLVCPVSFQETFNTHFSTKPPPPLTSVLARDIDVSLNIEVGQTTLTWSEWENVAVGDFILLDRCTFDPKTHKGNLMLVLNRTPLLHARTKESSIKIVDYAFYQQEQNALYPIPEQETFFEEIPPVEGEENFLPNPAEQPQEEAPVEDEDVTSQEKVPMVLTVEVGHLKINLDKLLQLTPGSILEFPVRAEQGVDVTVEGRKIAHAELIKLGEMIGIKILRKGE